MKIETTDPRRDGCIGIRIHARANTAAAITDALNKAIPIRTAYYLWRLSAGGSGFVKNAIRLLPTER